MLDGCLPQSFAQLPLDARFEQPQRQIQHDCFGSAPRPARQALRELDDARARSARHSTGHDGCAEDASVHFGHSEAALHSRQRSAQHSGQHCAAVPTDHSSVVTQCTALHAKARECAQWIDAAVCGRSTAGLKFAASVIDTSVEIAAAAILRIYASGRS